MSRRFSRRSLLGSVAAAGASPACGATAAADQEVGHAGFFTLACHSMCQRIGLILLLANLVWSAAGGAEPSGPARWEIVKTADGWRLVKDGEPFYVKGAVAPSRFDVLRACGGNAVRAAANRQALDAAHREGLAVMANLPVRGQRNGIDWNNAAQVDEQKRQVLQLVREFKNHPAVMFWSLGNELDHVPGGPKYDPQLWDRLNDLAVAVKQIDTSHPVLTVVGTGHFETKIQEIARVCKDMDLVGINAYGDLAAVTESTRKYWPKPYVITEWGPTGHWQVPRTKWRVPLEQTSSQKAQVIADRYQDVILADRTHCLGSFVFYWSEKQETTHTWYGLFSGGLRTESIDVMQHFWTGQWPKNRAPALQNLAIDGFSDPSSVYLQPAKTYRAHVQAADPDSDELLFTWDIRPEVVIPPNSYAGGLEKRAEPIEGLIRKASASEVEFIAPEAPGPYRLFLSIVDGNEHIAYGNIPFFVQDKP